MNNKNLKLACAAAFACIIGLALLGASGYSETSIVEGLIKQRTDVMDNVLTGRISFGEGKEKLKEIEGEKLLSDDLKSLIEYRNTDIDKVVKMKVINMEKKSHIYDMMTFESEICWTFDGVNGRHTEIGDYLIGVKVSDDEYKLISLEFQR